MTFREIRKSETGDYLITIAIGDAYLEQWESKILPSWKMYAEIHNLGIGVVTSDLIDRTHRNWKKPTWQKLLLPKLLTGSKISRICYLDTDILINPFAPNVFDFHVQGKIGVTSIRFNMPYQAIDVQKRLAYLRNKFLDSNYPLDSALFFSTKQLYEFHGFSDQGDEFCAGFLLFSPSDFHEKMETWFNYYNAETESITNGGDQTHVNFHILKEKLDNFLPYRFQAIWAYEAAWNRPDLFESKFEDPKKVKDALNTLLLNNYFLHFAGGSRESRIIWNDENFNLEEYVKLYKSLNSYAKEKSTGIPVGTIFAE
jgi:hypothetical protein